MPKGRTYLPAGLAVMTHAEIAEKLGNITPDGVAKLEYNAYRKLRRNPAVRQLFLLALTLNSKRSNNIGALSEDEK